MLYCINKQISSSKNSARFMLQTNNEIFRPIPQAIVWLKTKTKTNKASICS